MKRKVLGLIIKAARDLDSDPGQLQLPARPSIRGSFDAELKDCRDTRCRTSGEAPVCR